MYSFKIKADASDIDVPVVRSLLILAAIIIVISKSNTIPGMHIAAIIALLIAAFITEVMLVKYRLHPLLVIGIAALLLAICTFNFIFPIIIMAIASAARLLYVPPIVKVEENRILVKKTFSNKTYDWGSLNLVILKDGLLSLDFKNNKVLQLELNEPVDENIFNEFCSRIIMNKTTPAD